MDRLGESAVGTLAFGDGKEVLGIWAGVLGQLGPVIYETVLRTWNGTAGFGSKG